MLFPQGPSEQVEAFVSGRPSHTLSRCGSLLVLGVYSKNLFLSQPCETGGGRKHIPQVPEHQSDHYLGKKVTGLRTWKWCSVEIVGALSVISPAESVLIQTHLLI